MYSQACVLICDTHRALPGIVLLGADPRSCILSQGWLGPPWTLGLKTEVAREEAAQAPRLVPLAPAACLPSAEDH